MTYNEYLRRDVLPGVQARLGAHNAEAGAGIVKAVDAELRLAGATDKARHAVLKAKPFRAALVELSAAAYTRTDAEVEEVARAVTRAALAGRRDWKENRGTYGEDATFGEVVKFNLLRDNRCREGLAAFGIRLPLDPKREADSQFADVEHAGGLALLTALQGIDPAAVTASAPPGTSNAAAMAAPPTADECMLRARLEILGPDGAAHASPAALAAAAGAKGAPVRFRMVAHTGAVIDDALGRRIFDLNGIGIPKQRMTVLREHAPTAICGWSDSISTDGGQLDARGVLSQSTADGIEVAGLLQEGAPFEASVYLPPSKVEQLRAGETALVNGRTIQGPARIFRQTTLRHLSICAQGADSNTTVEID